MPHGKKKTRDQIKSLLNKGGKVQMPLFDVSDQPLRESIFTDKPESKDKKKQTRRKLFENDKK
jgi:hypothetical protein